MAQVVVGDLQGLWGLSAVRGRFIDAADEQPGAPRVGVLAHRFWRTRFGAAEDVVGRELIIDGQPHTVAGVLTPDIELGNVAEIDLWLPSHQDPVLASRADRGWRPVGRLRPGSTLADTHAQVAAIATRMEQEDPDTNRDWVARVGPTREATGGAQHRGWSSRCSRWWSGCCYSWPVPTS